MPVTHPEEAVTAGLMAVIASTTYSEAAHLLKQEGHDVSESTLRRWCTEEHSVRFEKLREEHGARIEAELASNLLSNARLAAETERLAIEAARRELVSGAAKDPSRIARDLSQVKAQSVDKRLSLQGRPTQITEKRGADEILRQLVAMGVASVGVPLEPPDATAAGIQPRPETPVPRQLPAPKPRSGGMVWDDELGEMVYESVNEGEEMSPCR